MVEQVLRLKSDALAELYETQVDRVPGSRLPAALRCSSCSAGRPAGELQPYNSVLLLRSGVQRIAVHVDELLGNQEIVVKSIGAAARARARASPARRCSATAASC